MDNPKLTETPFKCQHCYTRGYMRILGVIDVNEEDEPGWWDKPGPPWNEQWQIGECPNCEGRNIIHSVWDIDMEDYYIEPIIIHPHSITYQAPAAMSEAFKVAIETIHVNPAAAANQFRVILERIYAEFVKDESADKKPKSLRGNSGIIRQLVDKNILSGDYAEIADVLANIGNNGSHYNTVEVDKRDAEMARDLCAILLNHIYENRTKGLDIVKRLDEKFPRESGWRNGQFIDAPNWNKPT